MKHVYRVTVEFGDCDPSGIVFHPNFFSWFDAASLHFFRDCGVPPWRDLQKTKGIIGTPIVSTTCDFRSPARYGDVLTVLTSIELWGDKSFTMRHELMIGDRLVCEARGVRVFAIRHPDDPERIRAVPVPADIRELCERKFPSVGRLT